MIVSRRRLAFKMARRHAVSPTFSNLFEACHFGRIRRLVSLLLMAWGNQSLMFLVSWSTGSANAKVTTITRLGVVKIGRVETFSRYQYAPPITPSSNIVNFRSFGPRHLTL